MKTIPKFTDLIAQADEFVEESKEDERSIVEQRHRYWFKNGYGISLIRFSPFYYNGSIEACLLEGSEESYDQSDRPVELFDCKFDEPFRMYMESEIREAIEYVRDLK